MGKSWTENPDRIPKSMSLQDNDRVEIYRPLTVDPKKARLKRAVSAKAKKTG